MKVISYFLIYFLYLNPVIFSLHYESFELSSSELRAHDLKELNEDDSEDLGRFMNEFFYDSKSQLIVDLNLFRELWFELEKYRKSTTSGETDYIQVIPNYFKVLYLNEFLF